MNQTFKRMLCLMLTLVMVFAVAAVSVSASVRADSKKTFQSHVETFHLNDSAKVEAIVVMDEAPVADLGAEHGSEKALAYERKLLVSQNKVIGNLDADTEVAFRYTQLFSGFSVKATVKQLKEIEKIPGVKKVFLSNTYNIPEVTRSSDDELNAIYASTATGALFAQTLGLSGDGIVVAVIDTGINLGHEALQPNVFIQNPALTEANVAAAGTVKPGKYVSEKIPFSYDYFDNDDDCTDENGHGSHVSGIIGGYLEGEFSGAAPGVQLVGMKVFGANTSTSSAIYFAALEDCYRLDVDVVNMSLGSPAGFTYDYSLENELYGNMFKKLDDAGITVFCSAGNEGSTILYNNSWWNTYPISDGAGGTTTFGDAYGEAIPTWYTDYGLVGAPSVYPWNTSVASANNLKTQTKAIGFDLSGSTFPYTDPNEGGALDFLANMAGEANLLHFLEGLGTAEDFEGVDVAGKIVAIKRGSISFQEKIDNAAAAGAVAVIVVNSVDDGTLLNMSVSGLTIPAIWVMASAETTLRNLDGQPLTLVSGQTYISIPTAMQISSFSSRGPSPDLSFKPQITGIGGSVYSCSLGASDSYEMMSGTSMSCPNVAGTFALILEYLRSFGFDKYMESKVAEDMMLSTADILYNQDGSPYSPRAQGAGLIDVVNVITADAIILGSTISAGDDPTLSGMVELTFDMVSMSSEEKSYLFDFLPVLDSFDKVNGLGSYNYGESVLVSDMFGSDDYAGIIAMDVYHEDGTIVSDGTLVLGEGELVTVDMVVALSPAVISFVMNSYGFENGFFFDGFVSFYDEDVVMNATSAEDLYETCHASFISYIGDWTDAPVMEQVDTLDLIWALSDPDSYAAYFADMALSTPGMEDQALIYGMEGARLDFEVIHNENLVLYGSGDDMYYAGINVFQSIEEVKENGFYTSVDLLAFSTELTDADQFMFDSVWFEPALIRNARDLIMVVTDLLTGEVYYVDDTEYVRKDTFDYDNGIYRPNSTFAWDGTYEVEDGLYEYVPSGTLVKIEFMALLDYPTAVLHKEKEYYAVVDYTAPTMTYTFDADTNLLTVMLEDDDRLAFAEIYDENGNDYVAEAIDGEPVILYQIDVTEAVIEGLECLYVDVIDYATNYISYEIPIEETGSNIPLNVFVDTPEGVEIEFNEDGYFAMKPIAMFLDIDDDHCILPDFEITAEQGGEELEVEIFAINDKELYVFIETNAESDEVNVVVTGVIEHDFQPVEIVAPSCTDGGFSEYRCTNCDELGFVMAGDPLGHTPAADWTVLTDPTCTSEGTSVLYCEDCGAILDVATEAALGHIPAADWTILTDATCTSEGTSVLYCEDCGMILDVKTESAIGHVPEEDWTVLTDPTCTSEGTSVLLCEDCGAVLEVRVLPEIEHFAADWTTVTEPTCMTDGLAVLYCMDCGDVMDVKTIPATGHICDEGEVMIEATCTSYGWVIYGCTECGGLAGFEMIEKADHTPGEAVVTTEPTYTEEGEETVCCTECGEVLATHIIPAKELPNGDITGEGEVDAFDYMMLKAAVLGNYELTEEQAAHADVNGDGFVDAFDYMMLKVMVLQDKENDVK